MGDISNREGEDAKAKAKNATKRVRTLRRVVGGTKAAAPTKVTRNANADKNKRTTTNATVTMPDDDDSGSAKAAPQRTRRQSGRLIAKQQREIEEREKAEVEDKRNKKKASAMAQAKKALDAIPGIAFDEGVATRGQLKRRRSSDGAEDSGSSSTSVDDSRRAEAKRQRLSKVTARQIDREAKSRLVTKIPDEDKYIVHPDFRLRRATFNGKNHTLGVAKHDRKDCDDVLKNAPYVTDMFQHLFSAETKSRPKPYMSTQSDINSKMRAILIDWLVEVHMKFRLVPETLYLCVNIIDRYCNKVQVQRSKLQLVGVTALLVACKYEEIYPPEVRDCVYITDRAYQCSEVLDMEQDIVQKLAFRITASTAYPFLQRFLSMTNSKPIVRHAASYYLERTLQEHDFLKWRPSLVCASAVILAMNQAEIAVEADICHLLPISDEAYFPPILLEYTGFRKRDISECAKLIATKVALEPVTASNRQLVAVKKKYDSRKYSNVSRDYDLPEMPEYY